MLRPLRILPGESGRGHGKTPVIPPASIFADPLTAPNSGRCHVDGSVTIVPVEFPRLLVAMQPMLRKPFHRPGWVYEGKCDEWRMLAFKDGRHIRLVSRQQVDHTDRFRELAWEFRAASVREVAAG
jgi:hypothetical protein